jgi:iron complex outermembrane receptor protein
MGVPFMGVALTAAGWCQMAVAEPAAAGAGAGDSAGLDEIVVTAARREENLQKAALNIAVVSGAALAAKGVFAPEDLDKTVPGLGLSPNGPQTQVYLRGVGTFNIAPYADSAVAFNVDQIFMSFPALISGNFFDLQRVEVLEGPQGTLYGRNATAGAINVITNKPTFAPGGDAALEVGNYSMLRVEGDLNEPFNDRIAMRLAGQIERHGGYFTDGLGSDDTRSARLQLLDNISDDLSVLLAGNYVRTYGSGSPYVASPFVDPSNPWVGPSTTLGNKYLILADQYGSGRGIAPLPPYGPHAPFPLIASDQLSRSEIEGVHMEVNWHFSFADLIFLPEYTRFTSFNFAGPGFPVTLSADGHQASAEARLASKADSAIKWLVGAIYFQNEVSGSQIPTQGVSSNAVAPTEGATSYALFADGNLPITDRFRATAGIRFTKDEKTQGGSSTVTTYYAPRGPFVPPFKLPVPAVVSFDFPGSVNFNNTSGKAGLEFDLTPQSLLYATASDAYKPGGFNPDPAPNTYQPEKLTAYDLGSKNRFFDGQLQANVDLFYWDYKNHQENVLTPLHDGGFAPEITNIGASTLKGVTLDIAYRITQDDLFTVRAEYNDAVFNNYVYTLPSQVAPIPGFGIGCPVTPIGKGLSQVNCSGKPFSRAPKWSEVVGFDHTFHLPGDSTLVFDANAHFAGSSYIAVDYVAAELQKDYALVDLSLTYAPRHNHWSIQAYVRNVGDKAVMTGGFEQPFIPGLVYTTIGPPRTYGGTFNYHF